MGVVKVIINGDTRVDLTPTTTEANEVISGEVFFNRSGEQTVGTNNPAPKAAGIYYTTCSTDGATQQKDITISEITSLDAGLQIRVRFAYNQAYNGTPTLKLNNFAAKEIRRDVNNAAGQYEWRGTETLDLVYDGTYWIIVDGSAASVTYYGVTKLNNAVDSSSEVLAASSNAVKTVNDSLTSHTGNTSNPHSVTAAQVGAVPTTRTVNGKALSSNVSLTASDVGAAPSAAGIYYGACDTAGDTQEKVVTISGITSLYTGLVIAVRFTYLQGYKGTPTLNLNNLGAKDIKRNSTTDAARYEWKSSEVVSLVYNGLYWQIIDGETASTTYYGYTKLSSATDSTSEVLAATPAAVKAAYDLANGKADPGDIPSAYTSNPSMDGTASPGSSTAWAKGDHVHPSDTSRVPVYGAGENLLRNWYFVGGGTGRGIFPVNQRGKNSYTASDYSINGWKLGSNSTLNLTSGGLQLGYSSESSSAMYQAIGSIKDYLGMAVTISVLDSTGLQTRSATMPSSIPSATTTIINIDLRTGGNTHGRQYRLRVLSDGTLQLYWYEYEPISTPAVTVYAFYVEIGSQQTLCHNEGTDANPVWVLNKIPDYEEELIRCQTSTADSTDTYANKSLATEQQLAYVESGTTASRAYSVGDNFCWNGLLYRVTSAISSGGTLTSGSNCEAIVSTDLGYRPCQYELVTDNWTSVTGVIQKLGNMIMICLRGTTAAALTSSSELLRVYSYPPGVSGVALPLFNGYTATSARVNAGTSAYAGMARIYANSSINSGANITLNGMYYI